MELDEIQARAIRIHDLYDELNRRERGRVRTREEFVLGFVGDVGDPAKLVMAEEGARVVPPRGAGGAGARACRLSLVGADPRAPLRRRPRCRVRADDG